MDQLYFARNERERQLDNELSEIVSMKGSDVEIALFTQNQEILKIIRESNEIIKDMFYMIINDSSDE